MSLRRTAGIRLERKKDASLLNWNLKKLLLPEKVCVPVPATAFPCVRVGEKISLGQKIADFAGPGCATVHASIPGAVEKIFSMTDALGQETTMVALRRHGEPKEAAPWLETKRPVEKLSAPELLKLFQESGLVSTDVSMQPVHAKIQQHPKAKTLIINGCEPEPYVTCEQVLILSHALEVLKGAKFLQKAIGANKIIFALEANDLEMIELIRSKIYFLKEKNIEVWPVASVYPNGLESTLLQTWFRGREDEAVVFPASTAFAVYEAVMHQKPFYERMVTVAGECVMEPRSLWLPIGISFEDALHACKGLMREPGKIIMGGPMAGITQESLAVPVMAGTQAILALPKEITFKSPEEPCIRCCRCVEHCPVSLSPVMITLAVEHGEFEIAQEWNVSDCIECGNCAYVCPAKRPMMEWISLAKENTKSTWAVTPRV